MFLTIMILSFPLLISIPYYGPCSSHRVSAFITPTTQMEFILLFHTTESRQRIMTYYQVQRTMTYYQVQTTTNSTAISIGSWVVVFHSLSQFFFFLIFLLDQVHIVETIDMYLVLQFVLLFLVNRVQQSLTHHKELKKKRYTFYTLQYLFPPNIQGHKFSQTWLRNFNNKQVK